jgi:ectoine hydroxylase-related dioxygenase (phytanoyl-CoA dioxygenase family)
MTTDVTNAESQLLDTGAILISRFLSDSELEKPLLHVAARLSAILRARYDLHCVLSNGSKNRDRHWHVDRHALTRDENYQPLGELTVWVALDSLDAESCLQIASKSQYFTQVTSLEMREWMQRMQLPLKRGWQSACESYVAPRMIEEMTRQNAEMFSLATMRAGDALVWTARTYHKSKSASRDALIVRCARLDNKSSSLSSISKE